MAKRSDGVIIQQHSARQSALQQCSTAAQLRRLCGTKPQPVLSAMRSCLFFDLVWLKKLHRALHTSHVRICVQISCVFEAFEILSSVLDTVLFRESLLNTCPCLEPSNSWPEWRASMLRSWPPWIVGLSLIGNVVEKSHKRAEISTGALD